MSGTSSGGVAVTGGRSLPVNVYGSGSGEVSSSGQVSACAETERSSLFSDSGNRLPISNLFAAAMGSLGPAQRYESLYVEADEFLNQRVNEELQRAFEVGIPSSEVYPSAEIFLMRIQVKTCTSSEELDIEKKKNCQNSRVGWNSFQVGYA